MKKALVFGASGQAGSYLVDQLLEKGYRVVGTYNAHKPTLPVDHSEYAVVRIKLTHLHDIEKIISGFEPDEVYNMASVMFAPNSWENPRYVIDINGSAVIVMLQAILDHCPKAHFIQAGSAEVFSKVQTPYGIAKKLALDAVRMYREVKGLHASTAIFYNMESPRRSDFFFAKKVAKLVVNYLNHGNTFKLGNLSAIRDWGWTPEYMEITQKITTLSPEDYVVATGESHSCREFVREALKVIGITVYGSELEKYCIEEESNVEQTSMYAEPSLVAKIKFKDVVKNLVNAELKRQNIQLENNSTRLA